MLNACWSQIAVDGKQKKAEQRREKIIRLLKEDGFEIMPEIVGETSNSDYYIPIWTHENSDNESITEKDAALKAIELLERLFKNHVW
jgi:hypothetical protein